MIRIKASSEIIDRFYDLLISLLFFSAIDTYLRSQLYAAFHFRIPQNK